VGDLMPRQTPSQSRLAPPALSSRDCARSMSGDDHPAPRVCERGRKA